MICLFFFADYEYLPAGFFSAYIKVYFASINGMLELLWLSLRGLVLFEIDIFLKAVDIMQYVSINLGLQPLYSSDM